MTIKDLTDDEKQQIFRIIQEGKDDLFINEYTAYFDLEAEQKVDEDGGEIGASVVVDTRYFTVKITFYPNAIEMLRNHIEVFRQLVYHELAHAIIDPLHHLLGRFLDGQDVSLVEDYLIDEKWEQAVERVSRIAYFLRWETNLRKKLKAEIAEIIG